MSCYHPVLERDWEHIYHCKECRKVFWVVDKEARLDRKRRADKKLLKKMLEEKDEMSNLCEKKRGNKGA